MDELVQNATFSRLFRLAQAADKEGYVAIAAINSPTSLTKGKEYRILIDKADDTLYYMDDAELPVYLIYPEDLKRFEPLVDVSDMIEKVGDAQGRLECRLNDLVGELKKIPTEPTNIKAGDVVLVLESNDEKPYIVAKVLSRDEMRYVGKVTETLVAHDLLVYHNNGGLTVSILASHRVRKIGSLQEMGYEPLAACLLEKLTVFDAIREIA
jgi:hypothetical protein